MVRQQVPKGQGTTLLNPIDRVENLYFLGRWHARKHRGCEWRRGTAVIEIVDGMVAVRPSVSKRHNCLARVLVENSARASGVVVSADGQGLVSQSGAVLLWETMRVTGLGRGWPGGGRRGRSTRHQRAQPPGAGARLHRKGHVSHIKMLKRHI